MSLLSAALVFGATPLVWYTIFEPSIPDTALFAAVALLVAAAGQPQNTQNTQKARASRATRWARRVAWAGLAVLPVVILWVTLSAAPPGSSLLAAPSLLATRYSLPRESRWLDVLFSSWHGFLSWTPVAYIALAGMAAYAWRNRRWGLAALAIVFASAWLVGAAENWMGGPSFGARHLTSLLAVLAPGLACAIDALGRRPAVALAPLVAAPIVWNHLLMVQYTVGLLPKDEPVSFARMVRQQADASELGFRFYPFAFPANVWFAWREGVPVDRYDLLGTERRRPSLDLVLDRSSDRFLLNGWNAPGKDFWGPVWWLGRPEATIAVPLALHADRTVVITVTARTRFEEPVVEADLTLQVNGHDVGHFTAAAKEPSEARFVVPAAAGRAIWRDGYNRISIVSRGVHRVDPTDSRPPGPIARRLGNQTWPVAVYRVTIAPTN